MEKQSSFLIVNDRNLVLNLKYSKLIIFAMIFIITSPALSTDSNQKSKNFSNQTVASTKLGNAMSLYNQKKYSAAALAFEEIIQSTSPNATVSYYAGLANYQSGKTERANQLFTYIDENFSGTVESAYARKMLVANHKKISSSDNNGDLPDSVKNLLPSDMQALLKTEEGKQIAQQFARENSSKIQAIKAAEKKGVINTNSQSVSPKKIENASDELYVEHPFSVADIAKDGAGGIDQGRNPNCWFEASISSLAQLPRGQRLLANTIRSRRGNKYTVRFHNDGVEYIITEQDMARNGIHDKALWASLIECAELKKFPDNEGANGVDDDQSRLEIGLGSITGCKAEVVKIKNCDVQELSSFIGSAIKSQNPIVAATFDEAHLSSMPHIVVPNHAYTIIDFEPSKSIVTLRNPHGRKSKVYRAPANSADIEFQQLDDGVVKLGLITFQKYFHSMARSFI